MAQVGVGVGCWFGGRVGWGSGVPPLKNNVKGFNTKYKIMS